MPNRNEHEKKQGFSLKSYLSSVLTSISNFFGSIFGTNTRKHVNLNENSHSTGEEKSVAQGPISYEHDAGALQAAPLDQETSLYNENNPPPIPTTPPPEAYGEPTYPPPPTPDTAPSISSKPASPQYQRAAQHPLPPDDTLKAPSTPLVTTNKTPSQSRN